MRRPFRMNKISSSLLLIGSVFWLGACQFQGPAEPGAPGEPGVSCTVTENADTTKTLSCTDGTTATVSNGTAGTAGTAGVSCTLVDNGDGSKTITCTDGTTTTVTDGTPGAASFNLNVEVPKQLKFTVTQVTIPAGGKPIVDFTVTDIPANRGAVGLKNDGSSASNVRVGLATMEPASGGSPANWRSFISKLSDGTGTTERDGTLVDHGDGRYTYTYAFTPANVSIGTYDATKTHRVSLQLSSSVNGRALPATNSSFDFVPAGGTPLVRKVVSTASCNECHGTLKAHGSRIDTDYCVTCHNPGTIYMGQTVDFAAMVHGIHSAHMRATMGTPGQYDYTVGASHNFSEVTYPQALNNCLKCHNGADMATPQGNNWQLNPTREACGSCHADVNFTSHNGNHADSTACSMCHNPTGISPIAAAHQSEDPTPNTPQTITGAAIVDYDIKSVTMVNATDAKIEFRVRVNGTAITDFTPATLNTAYHFATNSGPSFLFAYAQPQDGITTPADFNNLGRKDAQPLSVTLANIANNSLGTTPTASTDTANAAAGYVMTTVTNAFPAAPVFMRTVALQGYYTQNGFYANPQFSASCPTGTPTPPCNLARHAVSVEKTVTGDKDRRSIVDSAKCGNCHEWFLGHGGNRVYNTDVCIMCHVPNLTSSGRGADPSTVVARLGAAGVAGLTGHVPAYDPAIPRLYPEEPMGFKELIHGTHSSAKRALAGGADFDFVRDRGTSGVFYYDMAEVTFPGILNNCETCHKPGTYDVDLPAGVSLSTTKVQGLTFVASGPTGPSGNIAGITSCTTTVEETTGVDDRPAYFNILAARSAVCLPNDTDLVTTPVTATCNGCHTSSLAEFHFIEHGAYLRRLRSDVNNDVDNKVESCLLCHGPGRVVDAAVMHAN